MVIFVKCYVDNVEVNIQIYSQSFPVIFHRTPRAHQQRMKQYVQLELFELYHEFHKFWYVIYTFLHHILFILFPLQATVDARGHRPLTRGKETYNRNQYVQPPISGGNRYKEDLLMRTSLWHVEIFYIVRTLRFKWKSCIEKVPKTCSLFSMTTNKSVWVKTTAAPWGCAFS